MRFHRLLGLLGTLAVACTTLASAHAAIITQNFFGIVTTAAADNDFNIEAGAILRGSITFDSDLLIGDRSETLTPEIDPSLRLTVEIGGLRFDQDDDRVFPLFPRLDFVDGEFVSVDFLVDFEAFRFLMRRSGEFLMTDGEDQIVIEGTYSPAAVPEPGTLALFGMGLAGVGLLRRRAADRRAGASGAADPAR